jgi:hypothetical protein
VSVPLRLKAAFVLAAFAALLVVPAPSFGAFSNTPDPTGMIASGQVRAIVKAGNTIYVGGQFKQLRPGGIAVNNVAAFDAATGAPIRSFSPDVTGDAAFVHALTVAGGKLWIGGKFTAVDGRPRTNLAAVDLATGALDPNVDAVVGDASKYVKTLVTDGSRVYAGGIFGTVDGVTRQRLAAFQLDGTLVSNWKPRTNAPVNELLVDGSFIWAGGNFRTASGTGTPMVARETVARFVLATGALDSWQIQAGTIPTGFHAYDLDVGPTGRLFVGYGGTNWAYAFDTNASTNVATVAWFLKGDGNVQTVEVYGSIVLLGGHFTHLSGAGQPNTARTRFAAVDFNGQFNSWRPAFAGKFFGPWDIFVDGNRVWVGGQFTTVSGVTQIGIARFTDR